MKTILVIDDEPSILELFKNYLESEDVAVVTAENGKLAESMLERYSPDLIITDLLMPEKDGIETVRHIKLQYPEIKIITMSGAGNELFLDASEMLGADLAITKPIDFTQLKTQLADLLPT